MQNDIIINEFQKFNQSIQDQRIVLYGLGEKTSLILEGCATENVIALMDKDQKSGSMWGLPIIAEDEANEKANVIVIVARKGIESIIFNRIKPSIRDSIGIYNLSGENLREKYSNENQKEKIRDLTYWDHTIENLKERIKQVDVVSFDIFDTLIGRYILEPRKMYLFLEDKLAQLTGERKPYEITRIEVEESLFCKGEITTLEDINQMVFEKLNIPQEWMYELIQFEIKQECLFTYRKNEVSALCEYSKELGKKVILVSDMYLTKDKLEVLLKKNSIVMYDELFVSCEFKKSKAKGDLYDYLLKERFMDRKILHIGDHFQDDYISAQNHGWESFHLMSGKELMLHSTFAPIISHVNQTNEEILVGLMMKEMFSNPFALHETRGVPRFNSLEQLVGWSYLPLMLRFLSWICTSPAFSENDYLVFCGRDGYIINELYRLLRKDNQNLPASTYFLTSRKAAVIASIRDEKDLKEYLKVWYNEYKGTQKTVADVMTIKLSYPVEGYEFEKQVKDLTQEGFEGIIEKEKESILRISAEERTNYNSYIQRVCPDKEKTHYIFDYVTQGTIPFALSKIFKETGIVKTKGLCFMTNNIPNYYYKSVSELESMCGNYTYYLADTNFEKYHVLGELLFASKDPMLRKIDEFGEPVFEKEVRKDEEIQQLRVTHDYVTQRVKQFSLLYPEWNQEKFNEKLADFFCGIFTTDFSICSEEVISQLQIQDDYNKKHVDIWKEATGR